MGVSRLRRCAGVTREVTPDSLRQVAHRSVKGHQVKTSSVYDSLKC